MKHTAKVLIFGILILHVIQLNAQNDSITQSEIVKPRMRIIIDNDFGGDPDGLFQLAHHILSPSVDIKGVIGSQHYQQGFYGSPGTTSYACSQIEDLLKVMHLSNRIPIYQGGISGLVNTEKPIESEGARAIVREAMRTDTKQPLYVVCGAGLTNIASAYLMEPRIAKHIILVWIGGAEYKGLGIVAPNAKKTEYNLGIDIKASQVIFNLSDIVLWQVPRNTYRQALYSYSELRYKMNPAGTCAKYLIGKLENLMKRSQGTLGEAYVLGDSPLVLLTALQSSWEKDPSSCHYEIKFAPGINDSGEYVEKTTGRVIRVYTQIDNRLMLDDMLAKLAMSNFPINESSCCQQ